MIGSLGWMEIAIIVILALLVVGPKGLPKLGKGIGRAIRDFKREASELKDAVEFEIDEDDRKDEQKKKKRKKKRVSPEGDKTASKSPNPKPSDKQ